ncbi:hypothetical protein CBR_g48775 [Chara braunii]|uniref:Uncharacterized protein n=1 Tax=Chara braunii TaxID=69332 RepID=A0A388M3B4_CHABU|nr:hypothetical protein CBR_g48775 [Chara braunii]|eukprot:GBG89064.1 hypothetical protein CBR_g48775 [Chara braunii]
MKGGAPASRLGDGELGNEMREKGFVPATGMEAKVRWPILHLAIRINGPDGARRYGEDQTTALTAARSGYCRVVFKTNYDRLVAKYMRLGIALATDLRRRREGLTKQIVRELMIPLAQLVDDLPVNIISRSDNSPAPHVLERTLKSYLQWTACSEELGSSSHRPSSREHLDPLEVIDLCFREEADEEEEEEEEEDEQKSEEGSYSEHSEGEPSEEEEEKKEEEEEEEEEGGDNELEWESQGEEPDRTEEDPEAAARRKEEIEAGKRPTEDAGTTDPSILNDPYRDPEPPKPEDGDPAATTASATTTRQRSRSRSPSPSPNDLSLMVDSSHENMKEM